MPTAQEDKTIFISIIAYNEPDISQTISNCLENAEFPERLRFGVWNHYSFEKINVDQFPHCKVVDLKYDTLLGVGVARLNALSLYDQEDYVLQIDAHMLFDKNWDTTLVSRYERILQDYRLPVITGYIGWWSRLEDGTITHYSPENNYQSGKMVVTDNLISNNPYQTVHPVDWSNDKPYEEHFGFSAHFVFSLPSFFKDIMPDPEIMFAGEETTTAMRAWTRGYRLFSIKDSIVWHRNKGDGVLYKNDRWKSAGDPQLYMAYERRTKLSEQRTQDILTGNILGYWGAPSLELLREYEEKIGIRFGECYGKL